MRDLILKGTSAIDILTQRCQLIDSINSLPGSLRSAAGNHRRAELSILRIRLLNVRRNLEYCLSNVSDSNAEMLRTNIILARGIDNDIGDCIALEPPLDEY